MKPTDAYPRIWSPTADHVFFHFCVCWVATLPRCLTGHLRSHCNLVVTDKTTYNELRAMILRYDAAVTRWEPALMRSFEIGRGQTHGSASDGPSPMDVDRVQKGKGKGKGGYKGGKGDYKGDKGKGKGKGKYDNKGGKSGGKHGKGDNYATGKGKGGDSCHWKRDCRKLKWDKEHNNVRMTSSTGGDMQTPYNHQQVPPPPNTGGSTSVPQSSAASNASTGTTFRTATTVKRVSGTTNCLSHR